jgi:hypothetical protein
MISQHKKENERWNAKNAVGKYVYELRRKLDGGEYEKYSDDKIREKLLSDLQTTEDWLYAEGLNEEQYVYVHQLEKLKVRR